MVQVWKGENGPVVQNQLEQILTGGYAALLSAGYYLDVQIPNVNQTWYLALGKTLNLNLARSALNTIRRCVEEFLPQRAFE
jgi:ribulose bisphosphate carboxylase small subunit